MSEMEILHNGTVVDEEPATASIMLDVAQAELSDTGSYTCRVVFSVSSSITADMGTLTVVGKHRVSGPPLSTTVRRRKRENALCLALFFLKLCVYGHHCAYMQPDLHRLLWCL